MKDLSINLAAYRLMVTEEPAVKMRELEDGSSEPVTNQEGEVQFVVTLFVKPKALPGRRQGKGEEIRVNLPADPGEGFVPGTYVELISPVLNSYAIADQKNPGLIAAAGNWFKAEGLKPVSGVSSSADLSGDLQ
ncbi:hypothetical protein [Amycolatopsis minnesotensis]|uniref:Uncharacterized protein n=1 Tax=Amycolatopsis minnesotensis TaxID=337894 RepID=A0ABP5ECA6_9PSEU